LIGDLYGPTSLPRSIPPDEFEAILSVAKEEKTEELLLKAYKEDLNARPVAYTMLVSNLQ
jgi:hypothetical protein